jgi:multicomponent Na+:H+ antiporter subunit D
MMSGEALILAALLIPLIGGAGLVLLRENINWRDGFMVLASVALLVVIIQLVLQVADGARPSLTLLTIAPGLGLSFTVEPLGALFAGLASTLWVLNSIYAIGYMRGNKEKDQTRFYFCICVAISAAMGVAMSGDLITLFIAYEVLSLSTYPLVAHKGDEKARRGARIYIMILLATSLGFFLPAIIATYVLSGTTTFILGGVFASGTSMVAMGAVLILFAFGIGKAGLMPFHSWLPNAMVAPTPVSALLHAVAVVKAGVFSMLKVALYVFGADTLQVLPAADFVAWVAAATILIASTIALTKDNLKARLAFSTVSQLSYVTLGAMIATPAAILGAALQILMHAFGKITLFMTAGAIYTATKRTDISKMVGLGAVLPMVFLAYLIGALSIIGLPPLAGAWPKLFLMEGAIDDGMILFALVFAVSSVLNVIYLLPVAARAYFKRPEGDDEDLPGAPPFAVVPPVITAICCLVLFFFAGQVGDFLSPILEVPADAILDMPGDAP